MSSQTGFIERLSAAVGTRYGALLLVLLIHLGLFSFLEQHKLIQWGLDLSILALIASALHAISGRLWIRRFVMFLGVSSLLLNGVARELGVELAFPFGTLTRAILFGVVIVVIFSDVLKRSEVDMDAVFGACCVYLLMALTWEAMYSGIEWLTPGSFALPTGMIESQVARGAGSMQTDLLYFSLITMTTIGYGDITPTTPPARILAALQGLMSQLYLAIIIARMVGMELAHRRSRVSRER